MKILLIYYTGTYNTRYITNLVKSKLTSHCHQVTTYEVNIDSKPISLKDYDLVGFGYPIYAFNAPKLFIDYLKTLTFNKKAKYFIYKNSGETVALNNASSREIKHILKKNKLELINEHHFLMPYNIHFRFVNNCVKEMLNYDDKLADILVYELEHNINSTIKNNIFYETNSLLFLVQRFGAKVNHYFYKVDENKCIKCYKCLKACPTHNISIRKDGTLRFNNNCMMCMRCSLNCPTDAIKIGLLESWKVNRPYNFKEIMNDESLDGHFIKEDQKGFFKCYRKTYEEIDKTYSKYFK